MTKEEYEALPPSYRAIVNLAMDLNRNVRRIADAMEQLVNMETER
jgi:hypothetical protein